MSKIIAVVGMCGSGKSEAVKFFVKKGYKRVYFGDVVFDEMKKEQMEINEKNERKTREKLRKDYGMAAMAVLSIEKIKAFAQEDNVVIESMYSWDEFKVVKEIFQDEFKVLGIYTTKALRYERLRNRKERTLTKEEAMSRDINEIEKSDKGGPIAFADHMIINDSTLEDMENKLDNII